jgi:hypothetical protein
MLFKRLFETIEIENNEICEEEKIEIISLVFINFLKS